MAERFTLLSDQKWCGLIGIAGSPVLLIVTLQVEEPRAALVFCAFAGIFMVWGIWLFARGVRTAVITGRRSLFVRSLFSRQTIPWDEISRACWTHGFLGLTLHWPGGSRKIILAEKEGQRLLRILRSSIDVSIQEGWNTQYECIFDDRQMTRVEHDALIRSMYRCVILYTLPASILIALALAAVAQLPATAYRELAMKGVQYGLAAMPVMLVWFAVMGWYHRPKDPPADD